LVDEDCTGTGYGVAELLSVYRCPELRLGDENVKINVEVYDQFRIVVTKVPTV
jgi:hypothetical protein